jgi:hypothetical protein
MLIHADDGERNFMDTIGSDTYICTPPNGITMEYRHFPVSEFEGQRQ